jgi:dolichyl-phosphate-mannose--protein O-mannosyl transferase
LQTGDQISDELTPVRHGDIIQLRHVKTNRLLLTHDVASPLLPTNTEFTTVEEGDADKYEDTLFELRFDTLDLGQQWQSHMIHFQLIHVPTGVSLFSQTKKWPAWGGFMHDVNGNKKIIDRANRWIVNEVVGRKRRLLFNMIYHAFYITNLTLHYKPVKMEIQRRRQRLTQ